MSLSGLVITVLVSLLVEHLAVVGVGLEEEVLVAYGDPVQSGFLGELHGQLLFQVVVDGRFGVLVGHDGGREETYVVEHVGILLRYVHRVVAAHRQTGYGARLLLGYGAVGRVDELHYVGECRLERALHGLGQLDAGCGISQRRLARCGLQCRVAVGHDDDHRLGLALRDEVVEYLRRAAQLAPCVLVASHAVQQIEYGVALVALLVSGGSVDSQTALHAEGGAVVPYLRYGAVGHVGDLVEVGTVAADDEYVSNARYVANGVYVARIVDSQTVDDERIAVQLGREGLGGRELPYAVG